MVAAVDRAMKARQHSSRRSAGGKVAFLAVALAGLISLPTALVDTGDVPSQYAALGIGSLPCSSVVKAFDRPAQFTEADNRAVLSWE